MAETLESGTGRRRRSSFIVPGEWARLRRPRNRRRIVQLPTTTPPHREKPSPVGSVIGFMKWMRRVMEIAEAQERQRRKQQLAEMAASTALKKIYR